MADFNDTTPASTARNTPSEILFDMEDNVSSLRRHCNLVLCLSTDQGLEDVLQDALHQVADGLSDCHRDLKDKFNRLFEQIVRNDGDAPEPGEPAANAAPTAQKPGQTAASEPAAASNAAPEPAPHSNDQWSGLYARWLTHQAYGAGRDAGGEPRPGDEGGQFMAGEETVIVREMIVSHPTAAWQIAQKIAVLEYIIAPDPSDWADKRDRLLLTSIKDDVLAMGERS